MFQGITAIKPERQPYVLHDIEELIKINKLDEIAGPPPIDMDDLKSTSDMRCAIHIMDGALSGERSDPKALFGGDVGDKEACKVRINSYNPMVGGICVEGAGSDYLVEGATICLSGNGRGLGGITSGASVDDHGRLTVNNSVITTTGANRCATSAAGGSVLRVNDSVLISHGAPYGEDAENSEELDSPPVWLEIEGNCRTHCTVDNSFSYFDNCTVIADGWAALSTDMSMGYVYLEARDCRVIATKSGYGAYADFGCHDNFISCDFDVACQGVIMGGNATAAFEDCTVNCGTYLGHLHCVMGLSSEVGELTVKNSVVRCGKQAVLIRSQNAIITMDGCDISSDCGILVQTEKNADPFATKTFGQGVFGVRVDISAMDARGDIIHGDPERNMWVTLRSATLTGAIKNACIELDGGSRWFATADSDVILGCDLEKGQIDAPSGVTILASGSEDGEFELLSGGKLIIRK